MLDQQFFGDKKFHSYLNKNFVVVHAVRGEDAGNALYKKYSIDSTPTVLVALADGTEIDRLIGFNPPAEEYKDKVEEAYKSEYSLLNLTKAVKKDPNNLNIQLKLARKYQGHYNFSEMKKYTAKILTRPEEAKKISFPFGESKDQVSAYEFARYTSAFFSPEEVLSFLTEFPESALKEAAFGNLSWFLNRWKTKDRVVSVYEKLLKIYQEEPDLITPYVYYLAGEKKDNPEVLRLAEKFYLKIKDEPDHKFIAGFAGLLFNNGENEKAKKIIRDYIDSDSEDAEFYNSVSVLFRNMKLYTESFDVAEEWIKNCPQDDDAYYTVGRTAMVSAQNIKRGIECFKIYIKNNPEHAWSRYRIGMLYKMDGDIKQARTNLEKAVSFDPDFKEAKTALNDLNVK